MQSETKLPQAASVNQPLNASEKDIRQRLQEALRRFGYKQVDVSKETGIHHSTLSLWLQGKVKGNQSRIKETVEQWLLNTYAAKPLFSKSFDSRFQQIRQNVGEEEGSAASRTRSEDLVPIELSFALNGQPQQLCLLWSAEERLLTPEFFAKTLAEDYGLNAAIEAEIVAPIRRALDAHVRFGPAFEPHEEALCVVTLNVREEGVQFNDCFEWDLAEESNDPADVARALIFEHGLPPSFEQPIAFEIHKQLYSYRKFLAATHNGEEFSLRQKKQRGQRETSQAKLGENVRLEPVTTQNLLRPVEAVPFWSPQAVLAGSRSSAQLK